MGRWKKSSDKNLPAAGISYGRSSERARYQRGSKAIAARNAASSVQEARYIQVHIPKYRSRCSNAQWNMVMRRS
jgi:hypothetical protein